MRHDQEQEISILLDCFQIARHLGVIQRMCEHRGKKYCLNLSVTQPKPSIANKIPNILGM